MSNLRAGITFLVVLGIVLVTIFQMQLRGYKEVERINEYVLYEKSVDPCLDQLYLEDDVEYRIVCENGYVLKSGLSEYDLLDALYENIVTKEDLEPFVTFE